MKAPALDPNPSILSGGLTQSEMKYDDIDISAS